MTDSQAHTRSIGSPAESESSARPDLLDEQEAAEPEWPSEAPEDEAAATFAALETAGAGLFGCTVACRGQLSAARVLRDSFLAHHPGAGFMLVLVEHPDALDEYERTEVSTPVDIGIDEVEFARLAVACDAEQLRAVLLPRLIGALLESSSAVLYLAPSVQVFAGFDDVASALDSRSPVALTPRVLRPLSADGLRPDAADLTAAGAFDPSLLAVCSGAENFLQLWSDQVRTDPASAAGFTEGAPALVEHRVLRDPGIGFSVFNAGQRSLESAGDNGYTVDSHLLRSLHFDGFEPQRPWLLSAAYADRPRVLLSEHPLLAQLCAGYRNALVASGHSVESAHPFDELPDGTLLTPTLRAVYRRAWTEARAAGRDVVRSPFEPGTGNDAVAEFVEWACRAGDEWQRAVGCSRWAAAVWADDSRLQRDFPDPLGDDAAAFREWCSGTGVATHRIPQQAVHTQSEQQPAMVDQLGVAVIGSGRLAELVRSAVGASGLPEADTPYYPVVLRCDPRSPVPTGHYVVDVRPDGMGRTVRGAGEPVETWVLSGAGRESARRAGAPVTGVLTVPLPDPGRLDERTRESARARRELGSQAFVFGAFVDHGEEWRSNVLGLVAAFAAAFPDSDDVRLLVSVEGAERNPEAAERLRLATITDPRIVLVEREHDAADVLAACDCVASLHRSDHEAAGEAFALRLLGAAAHGIPVLVGEHGAASELLGERGATLVPCQGVGEPDVESAAAVLARVAADPVETARFGDQAREHLLAEYSVAGSGEVLRDCVERAYRAWRVEWANRHQESREDPLRPLLVARHALHRPPEVGDGGRNAMAPALRKAVLKALGHYDEHIREVMRSILDGVEKSLGELLRKEDGGADDPALLGRLAAITGRQERLESQMAGLENGMVRVRADIADQYRRLRDSEKDGDDLEGRPEVTALAERIETLTAAVERTLDRVDRLEQRLDESARAWEERLDEGMNRTSRDVRSALHATDALQRVVLREHERRAGPAGAAGTPVVCDAGVLRLPPEDGVMLPWLSSHATWDSEVSSLVDSLLEPDGVFLDVGAYVGYQTVRVLSRLGNSGAVVAVEPSAQARELLAHNVEVNVPAGTADRLTVLDCAAWDADRDLRGEPCLSGGARVHDAVAGESSQDGGESGTPGREETVRGARLDRELEGGSVLRELRLSVVHVDVGGRVHRALGGLVRLLHRDRPSVVCTFTPSAVEELGDDPAVVLREFGTWGYDLVPVGRTQAVAVEDLLTAVRAAGSSSSVKLWLRPRPVSS